ncbi:MAG: hypothetical protein ACE5JE_07820 [Thermoplasmata archaeon]
MKEISSEEMMNHVPDAFRDMASHLRTGVLSLPGVAETCYQDEAEGTYLVAFSFDDDPVLQGHMGDPLRVTLEVAANEARVLLHRSDLAGTEFQPEGTAERKTLGAIVESEQGETGGPVFLSLVLTSEEDLLAAVRLAHAKYDALMTG